MSENIIQELHDEMEAEYKIIQSSKKKADDPACWKPVEYKTFMPQTGVKLMGGIFQKMFFQNKAYIKESYRYKDYCKDKTWIEALADLEGNGWYPWLPASNDGRMLGGAANILRWENDPELKKIVEDILSRIESQMREDGYYNYYSENDSYDCRNLPNDTEKKKLFSERKNYDRVFWTRGMIAAGMAGYTDAYAVLRRMYDWFNGAEKYLPDMLMGYNATNGLPGGPLVYHTPIGRTEDMTVTQRFYDQDYLINAFIKRIPESFSHYPGERPHCYELLAVEAMLDEYRATGEKRYLDAALGAWEIFNGGYEQVGGSVAICEGGGPYPYGSLYITTGHVGETCGSVFWIFINQHLLQLFPDEEKYAFEIEQSLYNVLAACRTPENRCRYHNKMHGKKEKGDFAGSCCEVSSTLLLSDLPNYIYTVSENSVTVNTFAASILENGIALIKTETDFPYSNEVKITASAKKEKNIFLRIRIPGWNAGNLDIYEDGNLIASGLPGSYLTIGGNFENERIFTFKLSARLEKHDYHGWDQVEGKKRFAVMYGPVLMAFRGNFDEKTVPAVAVDTNDKYLGFKKTSELHFTVPSEIPLEAVPYFEIQRETFTCFPVTEK